MNRVTPNRPIVAVLFAIVIALFIAVGPISAPTAFAEEAATNDITMPCQVSDIATANHATALAPMIGQTALLGSLRLTAYGDDTVCTFEIVIRYVGGLKLSDPSISNVSSVSTAKADSASVTAAEQVENAAKNAGTPICRQENRATTICSGELSGNERISILITHNITPREAYPATVEIEDFARWTFNGYASFMPVVQNGGQQ